MQATEFDSIKRHLQAHGYTFRETDEAIIARDPVHTSGPSGLLACTGHNSVPLRTFAQALAFVTERS